MNHEQLFLNHVRQQLSIARRGWQSDEVAGATIAGYVTAVKNFGGWSDEMDEINKLAVTAIYGTHKQKFEARMGLAGYDLVGDAVEDLDEVLTSLEFRQGLETFQEVQGVTPNAGYNTLSDSGRQPEHMNSL